MSSKNYISQLPSELLLAVFSLCRLTDQWPRSKARKKKPSAVTLTISQVCRRWRAIALGKSALWTDIRAFNPQRWTEYYLQQARDAPLSILYDEHDLPSQGQCDPRFSRLIPSLRRAFKISIMSDQGFITLENELSDTSSSETTTDCPPTPPIREPYSRHHSIRHETEFNDGIPDDILNMTFTSSCDNDNDCVSSEVDVCLSRLAALPPPQPMSRVELVLDSFSPYRRLSHPRCDFGDVLRGLLSEWYSVGACLLATATSVFLHLEQSSH